MTRPEFGAPCNGCGHCCQTKACELSITFLKSSVTPCVALEEEGGKYWCGLLRTPEKYMKIPEGIAVSIIKAYATMKLRIGDGCDDNSP